MPSWRHLRSANKIRKELKNHIETKNKLCKQIEECRQCCSNDFQFETAHINSTTIRNREAQNH